ncbi:MAG: tyrosine--tRNA ligase [bacterium]|nr:tyrosine--tRNA ligase [bacterium]
MTATSFEPWVESEFDRQWKLISRGAVDLLPLDEFHLKLKRAIAEKRPLRVKQGFDPTSPDIHLGHTVGIRKLKTLQDLGHQIVLIVGDYTASVGDPSGRNSTRPQLSYAEILKNAETYEQQFFRILDKSKTEVRFNGEWFKKMEFLEVMKLAAQYTVARLLERDDFTKRFKANEPISVHELLYPLMQAYDSVAIRSDVELGGTEQKFNLLAGRVIQEAYGVEPQCILTLPLLVGTDGIQKMSKSLGNYVGITDTPKEIFGKVMSIPDALIYDYFELASDVDLQRLAEIKTLLADKTTNPMLLKKELGERLVEMYHPSGSGKAARDEFERIFSQKQLPDQIEQISRTELEKHGITGETPLLVAILTAAGQTKSNGEGRRLIEGGGVHIGDLKITDPNFAFDFNKELAQGEVILKVGKRRFLKITR